MATFLSEAELLDAASSVVDLEIPPALWDPVGTAEPASRMVRIKPLTAGVFQVIAKAGKDDPSLIPLLIIKESLVEPKLGFEQVKRLPVGLVHFLIDHIKRISGLPKS